MYLTIDLDCARRGGHAGVSAPPYGVPMAVVEEIALRVKASGKLRLADMAEYNPRFDVDGHGARRGAAGPGSCCRPERLRDRLKGRAGCASRPPFSTARGTGRFRARSVSARQTGGVSGIDIW